MDRKEANRLWREVSRGAAEGVPTGRTLHEFAQRVEALTIADFEARARKREAMFALGGVTPDTMDRPCGAICAGKVRDGMECAPGRCAVRKPPNTEVDRASGSGRTQS